jgi:hypothetical protein
LIAADNGRFEFGTFNRMEFIPQLDPVGPIPANSSIVIPVRVIRDYEKVGEFGNWDTIEEGTTVQINLEDQQTGR